ncbi:NAD dependent epimerase/dehydratase family protein [Hirsutella rhossiliensis]|uniref:NAD dependent epimerase/dehydratase family domain-containing protein n=1 Tax=Hirsutella rhossiliensis TaxID=111463 RepID=A0A9P8N8G0_9HYPO|nr:NAD dependent epimerase/dehydratase family domain-containing protein [Hirsutella rhossiliensis]KAH0967901.1 NAD dependent epimerase/dehydratase family domain-containing protein [Hirsutella rhossiliensis]
MALPDNLAIPPGSRILVTGANGLVGSHVANQFLQFGFNVRGTVRDVAKCDWLRLLFETKYGMDRFELLAVPDIACQGALDEAVKGVSAVIHVASILSFSPDPEQVIPGAVAGALNALKAAYKETSVKRFILTSSKDAAAPHQSVEESPVVTNESWNDGVVMAAWAPPPYTPERSGAVYSASKVEQEKAVWKFHEENKGKRPDLAVNTVLPSFNLGRSLDPVNQGHASSTETIAILWKGERVPEWLWAPMPFVDVEDTARLHVAAAVCQDVQSERVFGIVDSFNWDQVLDILRKQNPDRKFHDNFASGKRVVTVASKDRAEELLRRLGRPGWTSLEDSVAMNTEDLRSALSS